MEVAVIRVVEVVDTLRYPLATKQTKVLLLTEPFSNKSVRSFSRKNSKPNRLEDSVVEDMHPVRVTVLHHHNMEYQVLATVYPVTKLAS